MNVSELQKALKKAGFDPGSVDGVMGRGTIAAITQFQKANGMVADGIAGPAVLAALGEPQFDGEGAGPDPLQSLAMPWFLEAQRLINVKEDTGPGSNPLIIGWGKRLKIAYGNDEIPWCGLFVGHCVAAGLPTEILPANVLGARQWIKLGVPCAVPQPGAVMVFWRKTPQSGLGHVAFYVGEDAKSYHVLGGNQGDAVNVTRMARERFVGARWPKTALPPAGRPRFLTPTGALSTNEQ